MIPHCSSEWGSCELLVDGVPTKFSDAPSDIKVNTVIVHILFESYENSWGTMGTLRTLGTFAAKETSFLTSGHCLQRRTSPQGSTKYLIGVDARERAAS